MDKETAVNEAFLEAISQFAEALDAGEYAKEVRSPWHYGHTESVEAIMTEWLQENGGYAHLFAALKTEAAPSALEECKDHFKAWYRDLMSDVIDEEFESWEADQAADRAEAAYEEKKDRECEAEA